MPVFLVEHPLSIYFCDPGTSSCHVDPFVTRFALVIEWPDNRRTGLVSARDERVEPPGPHDHVVVHEDDVFSRDLRERNIARLVWRQIVFRAYEAEAALLCLGRKVTPDGRGRSP